MLKMKPEPEKLQVAEDNFDREKVSPYPATPHDGVLVAREKTSSKRLEHGVTKPRFVELKDDGSGIFKDVDYKGERAAYLIDRFLGFDLVPPTVIRQLDGEEGSMQEFIADAETGDELGVGTARLAEMYPDQFMKMWVFDNAIKNLDRHEGNFLVKNGRIYAIDHGRSMGWGSDRYQHYPLRSNSDFVKGGLYGSGKEFRGKPLPQEIIDKFKKFLEWEVGATILEDLLSELIGEENAAVAVRRIQNLGKLIVEKGRIPNPYI